jgi:hypothetical protein
VARAKRRRNKGRAYRFFLLAALTLLMAAFIARREIPFLMKLGIDGPHRPARDASENRQRLVGGGENLHPSLTPADEDGRASQGAARSENQPPGGPKRAPAGEEITGSERRQLGALIKDRSQ